MLLTTTTLCILLCFSNIFAEESQNSSDWKCFNLLDNQTQSSLSSKEQFFAGLFQLPSEYKQASETEKTRLINQWIEDLNGNDNEKTTQAVAYLGIVKANKAAKHLERLMISGKCSGRLRWVCTRSLGQTGDKGTIPTLISLLDSPNMETRLYSKVSLAEITGTYYGDDREKWKNWQSGKQPQLCTSEECKIAAPRSKTAEPQRSSSNDKLEFVLPDIYERIVDSQDYNNTPVLIMSGSCWCGGCQQDTEPFRKFVAEYESRGLAAIRTVAGDNELAALDFQKHYRLPFVQLLDTNRSFEKRYNNDGWTFLMLANREGRIIYKINKRE
jgi:peroxiredoxin